MSQPLAPSLLAGIAWSALVGIAASLAPAFPGRAGVAVALVAVVWAVLLVRLARQPEPAEAVDPMAEPLAHYEGTLSLCLREFEAQFEAVEAETARMLSVQAEAVERLGGSFDALQAQLTRLGVPQPDAADWLPEARALLAQIQSAVVQAPQNTDGVLRLTEEVAAHAEQVSTILAEIDGIARQTSMLALNASIEAARAGEAGRGFVLVAQEVGELSGRTSNFSTQMAEVMQALGAAVGRTREALDGLGQQDLGAVRAQGDELEHLLVEAGKTASAPDVSLDDAQGQVVQALQYHDIVAQLMTHLGQQLGGMRGVLGRLGGLARSAVQARDPEALGQICGQLDALRAQLDALAHERLRHPIGRDAASGGGVELF